MVKDKITPVKPILSKESLDYISNIDKSKGDIKEKDIKEYIKHALGNDEDQIQETFASFIAVVDTLARKDPKFMRITDLHIQAVKLDEKYRLLYKETTKSKSRMEILAHERLEWTQKNQSFDFFK